jgi:transcriptional regulator with XRE-family HTH domain
MTTVRRWTGREATALRTALRQSLRDFAEYLGVGARTVSKWEAGGVKVCPRPEMQAALDTALSRAGAEVEARFMLLLREPDERETLAPDDAERLVSAIKRPSRVDAQVIHSLADVLAAQRRLEDHVGSAAVVVPVSAQLDALSRMVTDAQGAMRPKLVDVTGQWALFAGWLTANMGRFDVSQSWFDRAAEWAAESGNVSLNSAVLSWKGHLAYLTGQLGPLVGLSQAARRDPGVVMAQRAYDAYQEARGHALAKNIFEAERCLGEAEALAVQALERPEETPPWAYYHTSPGFYVMEHGLVLRYLGLHTVNNNSQAIEYLTAGLDELPVEMQRSEWAADFRYQLAMCHVQGDDPDEACRRAIQAAEIANATGAVQLVRKLRSLHAQLAGTWPVLPSVSEFGEFVKE